MPSVCSHKTKSSNFILGIKRVSGWLLSIDVRCKKQTSGFFSWQVFLMITKGGCYAISTTTVAIFHHNTCGGVIRLFYLSRLLQSHFGVMQFFMFQYVPNAGTLCTLKNRSSIPVCVFIKFTHSFYPAHSFSEADYYLILNSNKPCLECYFLCQLIWHCSTALQSFANLTHCDYQPYFSR